MISSVPSLLVQIISIVYLKLFFYDAKHARDARDKIVTWKMEDILQMCLS